MDPLAHALPLAERWLADDRTSALVEMTRLLASCTTAEAGFAVVGACARRTFPRSPGALYILDDARTSLHAACSWGEPPPRSLAFDPAGCWAMRRRRLHAGFPGDDLVCGHLGATERSDSICVPVMPGDDPIGVAHLRPSPGAFAEDLARIASFAERVGLALQNLTLRTRLHEQEIKDTLTGMLNRHCMEETLTREVLRARRKERTVSIILLGLDRFARVNEAHGPAVGDAVLRSLGSLLRAGVRADDVACRYGGDQALLVLPEATVEDAVRRAEQLRSAIADLVENLSASAGVAAFPDHGDSPARILAQAERALWLAKSAGRGRVVVAPTAVAP